MTTTTNVQQVKLNIMTQSQYDSATKNPTELYMVTDASILPSQTGQSGKYLTTNGTTASWGEITIPTVNNPTITITQGGITKGSFTLNQASGDTIALDAGGGGGADDWGQSLQGDIELDNTYICAPYKCYRNQRITSFSASNVTDAILYSGFEGCSSLTSVYLPNLTVVGDDGLNYCFRYCTSLTTAPIFSNIISIGEYGMNNCFSGCVSLTTTPVFSSLTTIGSAGLFACFARCTSLTSISFPALTTTSFGSYINQLGNMLTGVSGCTIHFPSNLESTIQGLQSYPLFGGTNTILAFDLPATS